MRKKHRGLFLLMAVLLAVTGYAVYQVHLVGNTLQYLVPAPAPVQESKDGQSGEEDGQKKTPPNQPLQDALKQLNSAAEEWQNIISNYTLTGILEKCSFTSDIGESASGRLTCLGPGAFSVSPKLVRFGRLFDPEELQKGRRVILLDEQLAVKLFKIGEPVDRTVTLFGEEYLVAGIVRHEKKVGDYEDFGAYIPLTQMVHENAQLDALMVSALPIPGAGAKVAFQTAMESWQSGGSLYDLNKEGMAATLWLRVLAFVLGMAFLFRGIKRLNRGVLALIKKYRGRLMHQYAVRLFPWFFSRCLLFALFYALAAGAAAVLMNFMIAPVYTFPEWIPAVLVEWKDIQAAFWNVWQDSAVIRELRSPEILRLRFFGLIVQWCAALMGVSLAVLCRGRRLDQKE